MIEYKYNNVIYKFNVDQALFSPKGIDKGTEEMLKIVVFEKQMSKKLSRKYGKS